MNPTARYNDDTRAANLGTNVEYDEERAGSTTLAAVFADRESAHGAVHQLHDEGFRDTWIGITRRDDADGYSAAANDVAPANYTATSNYVAPEDYKAPNDNTAGYDPSLGTDSERTRVESDNWFMRFFGEGDESLHDALVRHGVNEADARAAGSFRAQSAIVTVNGSNHPERAAQILSGAGGQLITRGFRADEFDTIVVERTTAYPPADTDRAPMTDAPIGTMASEDELERAYAPSAGAQPDPELATRDIPTSPSWTAAAADDDLGNFRSGASVDESTRLQLREERLRVDKSRLDAGNGVSAGNSADREYNGTSPLLGEQTFTERRPGSNWKRAERSEQGGVPDSIPVVADKIPVVSDEMDSAEQPAKEMHSTGS